MSDASDKPGLRVSWITMADLEALNEPVKNGQRWGGWIYDAELLTLTHEVERYEVDLERMTTAAAALDWIAQVAGKAWATPEIVGSLVLAIDAILDLQATLCGGQM